ncbi:hypothetical protein [uncultured Pseudodesulfovibrio sp.]|uniref:hypothetical protein n=1 Tax=uncultured Pseudodesulfovibrio sp. TaxID=2035858 RepID=UPI0029C7381B|nr:hypothetical protein [uncultured Pseudodesulfovibrio sp.]
MSANEGKVHRLEPVRQPNVAEEVVEQETVEEKSGASATGVAEAQKDMSKVAMIVSLLAVLLLVIFFFGMNRNIAGLTQEVQSLGVLREDVANLDQRMLQMKQDVPVQMKRMLAHDIVNEMAMKAFYLNDSLEDEALRAKMQQVMQGLKEIREGLEK